MAKDKTNRNLLILLLLLGGGYIYLKRKRQQEALLRSQMETEGLPEEEESLGGGGGGGFGMPSEPSVGGDVESEAGQGSDVDIATGGGVTGAGSILNVNIGDNKPSEGKPSNDTPSWLRPDRPIGIDIPDKPSLPIVPLGDPIRGGTSPKPISGGTSPKPISGGGFRKPTGTGLFGNIGKGVSSVGNAIFGKPTIYKKPSVRPPSVRPIATSRPTTIAKPSASPYKAQLEAKAKAMAGRVNTKMRKFSDFDGDDMEFGLDVD
jgi:hypothetical protein